jgi:glucose/arabinose dehydrogenase
VRRELLFTLVLSPLACWKDDGMAPPVPVAEDSLRLELIAEGLVEPLFVTAALGDTDRLFVVEQAGVVRIVRRDTLTPEVFLDLRTEVSDEVEQGLLSIAFHPSYAMNGFVFASYTNVAGDTRVVRYRVSADPDSLDALSGDTIFALPQPFPNHNGGLVAFGPDGYLYLGLGDGGSGSDPVNHGQDLLTLLGSVLRLDVDDSLPYAVPPTNPFVGRVDALPEIWAFGLRNPWRFSFDRERHDLYIADVGQSAREEINVQPASSHGGENYGWNIMEGGGCFEATTCNRNGLVLPVVDYVNPGDGCAVTGGYVYRGTRLAGLSGTYFYADYCRGWVRSFRYANGQVTDQRDRSNRLGHKGETVTSFGEDARGELYIVVRNGKVYRIAKDP